VYIPTNGGGDYTGDDAARELAEFLNVSGYGDLHTPVVLIHTYSRDVANDPAFYRAIDKATGVWFAGGLPQRSYHAYLGTETEKALERLLRRNGVIGGTSAGALMQSNIMLRADRGGNHIVLGNPFIGFAFGDMMNIVIDVHNLHRNRAHDMLEALDVYPELLGINVDEDTAVVMKGDEIRTVGTGWVQIFDPTLWQDETDTPFCANFLLSRGVGRYLIPGHGKSFFLGENTVYNVHTREVTSALVQTEEELAKEL